MYMHVLILLCYTCTITHAEKQTGGNQDEGSPNVRETANGNGNENNPTFSIEEELRYATRFEEGYDIPDPKYEAWLRLNHPNVVSSNPSVTILQTTPSSSSASFSSPSSSQQHMPSISQASTKPNVPHKPPSATPCRSNQVSKSRRSPLSDLLNLPVQPNVKAKTGKVRVLTSSECLCLLLEKEEEKKRVAQEKERRKQERELKKQKEEEQKRKAEEKVRKAAEREAAKALKEAAKADREAAKLAEREKKKELQKSRESGQKRQPCPVATTIRPKRNKLKENVDDSINADLCCVCFGSYQEDVGTGREWLQCSCSRWIHEDCVDYEDVEQDNGRLCPLC